MPLGIVSDSEFEDEKRKLCVDKKESHLERSVIEKGRGVILEIPSAVREVIAEASILGESAKEIQKHFPVSQSSISAYSRGVTSTANYNGKKNERLNRVRERISKKSGNRVMAALDALGEKNLGNESARDISAIAKDMATVFEKLTPKIAEEREENKHLHLHIFAPKMKQLSDYEIIDLPSGE